MNAPTGNAQHNAASDSELIHFIDESATPACSPAASPWCILIVDDDPHVLDTIALALQHSLIDGRALSFMQASSAGEARTLLDAGVEVDLVLLDLVMETPEAGLELLRDLRNSPRHAHLRIVVLSGEPRHKRLARLEEEFPVEGYIHKIAQTPASVLDVLTAALRAPRALFPTP